MCNGTAQLKDNIALTHVYILIITHMLNTHCSVYIHFYSSICQSQKFSSSYITQLGMLKCYSYLLCLHLKILVEHKHRKQLLVREPKCNGILVHYNIIIFSYVVSKVYGSCTRKGLQRQGASPTCF